MTLPLSPVSSSSVQHSPELCASTGTDAVSDQVSDATVPAVEETVLHNDLLIGASGDVKEVWPGGAEDELPELLPNQERFISSRILQPTMYDPD